LSEMPDRVATVIGDPFLPPVGLPDFRLGLFLAAGDGDRPTEVAGLTKSNRIDLKKSAAVCESQSESSHCPHVGNP
jgi:hypothetical protein